MGTKAGQIQLTVIEYDWKAGAHERVRPTRACFAAAYCGLVSKALLMTLATIATIGARIDEFVAQDMSLL